MYGGYLNLDKKKELFSKVPFFLLFNNAQKAALARLFMLTQVWIGVEPTNRGFADRSLTAWVPHQKNIL